jgi:hypothetical protein
MSEIKVSARKEAPRFKKHASLIPFLIYYQPERLRIDIRELKSGRLVGMEYDGSLVL